MNIQTTLSASVLLFAVSLPAQEVPPDHAQIPAPGQPTHIPQPAPVRQLKSGAPNEWFEKTKLYMGEFLDKEAVKGIFKFKNPTGEPIVWKDLAGSCQCAKAVITVGGRVYELSKKPVANSLHRIENGADGVTRKRVTHINVQPKDEGTVEVSMEMGGIQGYKDATLAITTTDPNMKQVTLSWQAKGVKLFSITPNDVFLNSMKWGDSRKFSFVVQSEINPDFQLLEHEKLPEYVKVSKKKIQMPDGKTAWKIDGQFGPNADPKSGGASIKYKTDWEGREVTLNVIATVTGPITINPGTFISFSKIRKGKGASREIRVTPNGDFDLQMEKATFVGATLDEKYLSATAKKDGKDVVITVAIAPEAKGAFLVRGKLIIDFNHAALKGQKFNFNGILR